MDPPLHETFLPRKAGFQTPEQNLLVGQGHHFINKNRTKQDLADGEDMSYYFVKLWFQFHAVCTYASTRGILSSSVFLTVMTK